MKNIILVIILIFSLNLVASDHPHKIISGNTDLNLLYLTSPDSLLSVIESKPMILYMKGHRAHIWSIVMINNDKFQIICGRVDSYGENEIYKPIESTMIDTAAFLYAHRDILSWAFDSLPVKARQMKPVNAKVYSPFCSSMSVVSQDSTIFFSSDNAVTYSGPDSVAFNGRLKKLSYVMYWLAQPSVRMYTPDSVFLYKSYR